MSTSMFNKQGKWHPPQKKNGGGGEQTDVYIWCTDVYNCIIFAEDFDLAFIICLCMLVIVLFLIYGVVRVSRNDTTIRITS